MLRLIKKTSARLLPIITFPPLIVLATFVSIPIICFVASRYLTISKHDLANVIECYGKYSGYDQLFDEYYKDGIITGREESALYSKYYEESIRKQLDEKKEQK